jgi:protoporphyrinogen oxidase
VIGGGITGLAAANRVLELDPSTRLTLLEANGRLGGVLETVQRDGFMVEQSADGFITNVPWATDLCRRVGLADQLQQTSDRHRRAFVVCRNRLEPIPEGFLIMAPSHVGPMLRTPILSTLGKLRLLGELFVPAKRHVSDKSLASFVSRRLGRETYQRLVQPLVGGIYNEQLMEIANQEIAALLSVTGKPLLQDIRRWPSTMPQYHVGHVQLVRKIRTLAQRFPGLKLAGNAYAGVGIPHCIHSGEQAAEATLSIVREKPGCTTT